MHRWESSTREPWAGREPPPLSEPCGLGTAGTERHCSLHQRSSEEHLFTHREHWSCPFRVPFQCFQLSARHQLSPQPPLPPLPLSPMRRQSPPQSPLSCGKTEAPMRSAPRHRTGACRSGGCGPGLWLQQSGSAKAGRAAPPYLPRVHAQEAGQGHGAEQKGRGPVRG